LRSADERDVTAVDDAYRHDRHLALSRLMACYHDGMSRKTTTVRMPDDLAETAEVVARGRGISVNALVIDALKAEFDRVKQDQDFMAKLRELTERDKEILDRLAE
jgi:glutamate-1-semialdehyde aminotransferase